MATNQSIIQLSGSYLTVEGCLNLTNVSIVLDFGESEESNLWYNVSERNIKMIPLIFGSACFYTENIKLMTPFSGGCSSVSATSSIYFNGTTYQLIAENIKTTGFGSCHWIFVSLSAAAALVILILVPLLETYVWKITD